MIMANAQREFISELAKIRSCRQYPDSAWDSMLEPEVIGAATVERCSEEVYERINKIMEEANGFKEES